ncbi:MAG: ATP-dependent RNA helicase [Gammaproteobacteria bacterium]|nr:MAG: ATP-dependent RNA helicase [Gammaproteobacteria bacterium]
MIDNDNNSNNGNIHFADLALIAPLLQAVTDSGYDTPSPIQAETIPQVLAGTEKIDTNSKHTQVLVLAPTRELAIQVAEAYKTYARHLQAVQILPVYGGADYRTQLQGLKRGAHIVVGTPGRVMDHIERGTLQLAHLNTVVLDEADEMLRMGFIDDVEWILQKSPDNKQIVLFSATMPRQIKAITEKYLRNQVVVKIESKSETAVTIEQFHLGVQQKQKSAALRRILEIEDRDATIIFVNTKAATEELAEMLNRRGYRALALNGDLQQKQRERVIEQIKTGAIDIILATDVAARGLDVERITLVINYDLPRDSESYVHRIGRTGRAGRSGKAILLVTPRERRAFGFVEKDTKTSIPPYPMPSIDEINAHRIERFKQRIIDEAEHKKLSYLEELLLEMPLASMVLGKTPLLLSQREAVEVIDLSQPNVRNSHRDKNRKDNRRNNDKNSRNGKNSERLPMSDMECFRLAVGYRDNVRPGHIVGAIANEAGIEGNLIGPIDIHDDYTEVYLPLGMPENIFNDLKKARIVGKPTQITRTEGGKRSKSSQRPKRRRKNSAETSTRGAGKNLRKSRS